MMLEGLNLAGSAMTLKRKGIIAMTLGEKIQKYRKALGLSQEELGQRLFVSRQTVSLWEKNQTVPTVDNLKLLKEVFGVTVDEILSTEEKPCETVNSNSLDTICASLAYAMGIEPPKHAAQRNWDLSHYIDKVFGGEKADRVVMYNPDAIAQWIYKKYDGFFEVARKNAGIEIPLATVMPSVTPVCFGTMYTGAQPQVHGIQKYEKPIITVDTIFDALIRAGKRPVIISYGQASLSKIYLGRDMDYFISDKRGNEGIAEVNAKAAEIILKDEHDFIVIYNGNYDTAMHKSGPESASSLGELSANCHEFMTLYKLIENNWGHHNTLLGFAMDHGCHEIDGGSGSHGLDMLEDINITHLYRGFERKNK